MDSTTPVWASFHSNIKFQMLKNADTNYSWKPDAFTASFTYKQFSCHLSIKHYQVLTFTIVGC